MEFIRKNKAGILSGIVASAVFIYFIDPILANLAELAISVSEFLGTAYSDRIYAQAAQLSTRDYSFTIITFLISGMAGMAMGFLLKEVVYKIISKTGWSLGDSSNDREREPNSKRSKLPLLRSLILLSIISWSGLVIVGNYEQLSLISSFKHHMNIIAPFIDEAEEEILISKWSQMKSREDFENVYKEMENIASTNNVELPKNRVYSITSI